MITRNRVKQVAKLLEAHLASFATANGVSVKVGHSTQYADQMNFRVEVIELNANGAIESLAELERHAKWPGW